MVIEAYLLDTNAASAAWDANHLGHNSIRSFLENLGNSSVFISAITIAEIEYGLKTAPHIAPERQKSVRDAMEAYSIVLKIDKHTATPYSDLRAALFSKYSPRNDRKRLKMKHIDDLSEKTSGKKLGVNENDLWIASQAIQYNLVLVTDDRMFRIRDIAQGKLRVATWNLNP